MKWHKVPGFLVEVTKHGGVRHFVTKEIKKQFVDKAGYKLVNLRTDEGRKTAKGVHQLVALVFCKGYKKGLEINHKDLDKSNNYYKNLEWCTGKENANHAIKHGVDWGGNGISRNIGENNPIAKLTKKKAKKIRELWATGNYTQRELAIKFYVSQGTISYIVNKKIWKNEKP